MTDFGKFCFIYFLGVLGALGGLDIFGCGQKPSQDPGGKIHIIQMSL
ncbi:hypothetical protein JW998_03705 [candidate division KSB1 bacterium]|nr:hypothetical protein [candidate division KSB1 bacterium]